MAASIGRRAAGAKPHTGIRDGARETRWSEHRSLQLGLGGEAVQRYVDEWTVAITDVTPVVARIRELVRSGKHDAAAAQLPAEHPYPLPERLRAGIGASPDGPG